MDDIDNNLQEALRSCTNDLQYDKIRTVGAAIAKGLTLHEACIISHVDIDKLISLRNKHAPVDDYLNFKQTTFKATLIKQLSTQALNGDSKLATWFMERLYDEYNPRARRDDATSQVDDLLRQGLDYIRKNGDRAPLVAPSKTPTKDNE